MTFQVLGRNNEVDNNVFPLTNSFIVETGILHIQCFCKGMRFENIQMALSTGKDSTELLRRIFEH